MLHIPSAKTQFYSQSILNTSRMIKTLVCNLRLKSSAGSQKKHVLYD